VTPEDLPSGAFDVVVVDPSRIPDALPPSPGDGAAPAVVAWCASPPADLRPLLAAGVFSLVTLGDGAEGARRELARALTDSQRRTAEHQARRETEARYRDLSTVVRLNLEVGAELSVDRVLARIVDQIADDLGFHIVSVMLIDEDGEHMTIRAARGLASRIISGVKVEVGRGVSGWVAQTGQPLLVNDIENHPLFKKLKSHGRYSSKSLISVPLKVQDRVIGVLNGNNRGDGEVLTVHDLRLLSIFASQASLTIERARLYQHLEDKAAELSAAYERLREVDQMKSDFITNVSHEFRTPLTIILGYLDILKGRAAEPALVKMVDITLAEAHRLSGLMEDITDMLRLDTGGVTFEFAAVSLEEFLRQAVAERSRRFAEKRVEMKVEIPPGLPAVRMDSLKMSRVLDKLLDNSLKFTPAGGVCRVRVLPWQEGAVVVMVEDSGPGIPISDRERVFGRFEQGGDIMTDKPKGTGLGLPIARAIVTRHGGSLWLDESFTSGCRIVFTLPPAGGGSIDSPSPPC
jgi:signal transduction histidine kinase